jgi:predicted metal-dependent hydrolase
MIHISDLSIQVMKKDIKNVHLSVHPPDGRVTLVAPTATRLDAARLNTELVKKPKEMLEYVIFHEMAHLLEPTQSDRCMAILGEHYPTWREACAELNELPLTAEVWKK